VAAMDEDRVRGQPVASMAASAAAFERAGHARLSVVARSLSASSLSTAGPVCVLAGCFAPDASARVPFPGRLEFPVVEQAPRVVLAVRLMECCGLRLARRDS
jgi:hypothetical protein